MKTIESLSQWLILKQAIIDKGYKLWRMQYSYNDPEGFHIWIWKKDKQDVEIVTHNKEVQDDILTSGLT